LPPFHLTQPGGIGVTGGGGGYFLKSIFFTKTCIEKVHLRKQKLASLCIQIARQAVQSSSEFYDFFVASYLLFLSSQI
jgi:hypothetical protein